MKKLYFFVFLVIFAGVTGYSQKAAIAPGEVLQLKESSFDFGKIPQGRPVTHNFEVVNRGKTPLMIENVEAACGCTTPEWKQEPIAPGASSLIKVGFNAATEGRFQKNITVHFGGDKVKSITISGEVYPMPTTSAPPNPSLTKLKQ